MVGNARKANALPVHLRTDREATTDTRTLCDKAVILTNAGSITVQQYENEPLEWWACWECLDARPDIIRDTASDKWSTQRPYEDRCPA